MRAGCYRVGGVDWMYVAGGFLQLGFFSLGLFTSFAPTLLVGFHDGAFFRFAPLRFVVNLAVEVGDLANHIVGTEVEAGIAAVALRDVQGLDDKRGALGV